MGVKFGMEEGTEGFSVVGDPLYEVATSRKTDRYFEVRPYSRPSSCTEAIASRTCATEAAALWAGQLGLHSARHSETTAQADDCW